MDIKKNEGVGCLISTTIMIAITITGFFYFTREFTAIFAAIGFFVLPALPVYYFIKKGQYQKKAKIKYQIIDRIKDYAEELENLSSDIKNYNPKDYEETKSDYLESIQEEVSSIAERLNEYHDYLQWDFKWEWEE